MPLVRRPDFDRIWLSDLTLADFGLPSTAEEATAIAFRFKHVAQSEALRALAGHRLANGRDGHHVDLLLDESAELVCGLFQNATAEDLVELSHVRLDSPSGSLYIFESQPRVTAAEADIVGALLARPYGEALGEHLDTTLQELGEAEFWLKTLARHLQDPDIGPSRPDLAEEVRIGLGATAVMVLTQAGTDARAAAKAILPTWRGTPDELLVAVGDVLEQSAHQRERMRMSLPHEPARFDECR
jgi:hypothetical protein